MNIIGSLQEKTLHAQLKQYYCEAGGETEVLVAGYIVDVLNDGRIVEIQTGSFSAIKTKLNRLLENHSVRLVYPLTGERWLLTSGINEEDGVNRRKSPKKENLYEIFGELVSFPSLIHNDRFTLEVAVISEELVRQRAKRRTRRNSGWKFLDRRLVKVLATHVFSDAADFDIFLPETLPEAFTTRDLADLAKISRSLSQKSIYCLREMGQIKLIGSRQRFNLYTRCEAGNSITHIEE